MLNINPEIVCQIISKAKEFQAKEAVTFTEEFSNTEYEYDGSQILADHVDDLTYSEVKNIINELEPDQRNDLLALFYLGREDFENWSEARKYAKENLMPNLTDYLFSKPQISDFLARGLIKLGYACEEDR